MPFDAERIIQAALEAALEEPSAPPAQARRHRLSTGRAVLIGAGVATAARLAIRMRGGRLVETLHERLMEYDERSSSREDGGLAEEPALEGEGEELDPEEEEEFDPEDEDEELAPDEEDEEVPVARSD